jgi:hypothetical protein
LAGGTAALAEGFVEDYGSGGRDVEGADASGHGNTQQMIAGAANQVVEARAFAAEHQDTVASEVELVVVARAALVESDDPEIAAFEFFKGADEVDDAGDAQMFGGAGAGFDGYGAQGGRTPLGEQNAVHTGAVGNAQESAEILRILDSIESEQQAGGGFGGWVRLEEVFDGQKLLRTDQSHDALVGGGLGELGQLLARLLADAEAGLAAEDDQALQALIVPLAGHQNMVEAPTSGLDCLFNRMQPVENFHKG